jgi:hypothetical protein
MSDPWSEDPQHEQRAKVQPRLPLAHSAPEYGEAEPTVVLAEAVDQPEKKPLQFSLARLQLVVIILCISSACLGALLHVNEDDFTGVTIMLLILPSGILILLGIGRGGYELYKNWRADQALWHQEPWQSNQTSLPPEHKSSGQKPTDER